MMGREPRGASLLQPGLSPPAVIAHAVNGAGQAASAIAAGADYVEVDLWVERGRLDARHERRLPFHVPLLYEKWYVRGLLRTPVTLEELVEIARSGTGLFLDLKGRAAEAAPLVAGLAEACGGDAQIAASSQSWQALRPIARDVPSVQVFYSIDVAAKLDLFLSVADRDARPHGVSCRERLLTDAVLAELRRRRMAVVAWTVDDPTRAMQLANRGVVGITTERVSDVAVAIGRRAAP